MATFGANLHELIRILKTGAVVAGVLLILGAFAVGYLLSRRERRAVLGLGTAQRNVAAAMVIASRDFTDPDVLVMVTACVARRAARALPDRLAPEPANAARRPSDARRRARINGMREAHFGAPDSRAGCGGAARPSPRLHPAWRPATTQPAIALRSRSSATTRTIRSCGTRGAARSSGIR